MPTQAQIADALAIAARAVAFQGKLTPVDIPHLDALAASLAARYPTTVVDPVRTPAIPANPVNSAAGKLTLRPALELAGYEALVPEWYLDSKKIGTWGIGVTNRSGHNIDQYKDNPQTIERCLEVYLWLVRTHYLPDVIKAFPGHSLTETQLGAALCFHYNTGAILHTDWVGMYLDGHAAAARAFWETHYLNAGTLTDRRMGEAKLFFEGEWQQNGHVTVLGVNKPSYTPRWSGSKRPDLTEDMRTALAA